MKDFSKEIMAYALKNALEFGKADAGKILPKLFQHGLEKKDIQNIMPSVQKIVKEVNSLKNKEKEFEKYRQYVKEHAEELKGLPELPNAGEGMVFRLAPYPSGALHIGNAKTYLLNALYAERYSAKTLLIMDDTIGSEEKQIAPEAYELIESGFKWLNVKYSKVYYKSDRLDLYYSYGEKLLQLNKGYICTCAQEVLRKNRESGKECSCRILKATEQNKRWKEMFSGEPGSAVMRLKTSMQHPNPAFRDRVLFKISDRKHPRVGTKYRVWPTLEMSWAVDDHEFDITHILRGNDLMIETDMEKFIWDIFSWKHPVVIHTGLVKLELEGAKLSKSKAQQEVKSGEFSGWDDPRTWSIQSLERRGIKPEAVREFIEEIGLNKQDITVPIEALYSHNRKLIDAEALRHSFVAEPVGIRVKKAPVIKKITIPVHPDKKEMREMSIGTELYIGKSDFEAYKGQEIRLLHLYNIKLSASGAVFTSEENKPIQKINWVTNPVKARILMPNGIWKDGYADSGIAELSVNDVIQFERYGFCRLDAIKKNGKSLMYEFWFGHK